jgi:hypothetical protein
VSSSHSTARFTQGDVLQHHSVPGFFHVLGVEPSGRIILLTPEGNNRVLSPETVHSTFTVVDNG